MEHPDLCHCNCLKGFGMIRETDHTNSNAWNTHSLRKYEIMASTITFIYLFILFKAKKFIHDRVRFEKCFQKQVLKTVFKNHSYFVR